MVSSSLPRRGFAVLVLAASALTVLPAPGSSAPGPAPVPSRSPVAEPPAATLAPMAPQLEPFRWLVGGAWRADTSALPGGLKFIETRYDLAPNGAVVRFTTKFVDNAGSTVNGYAGNLFYDPAAKSLMMWYIDSKGAITQGPVALAGDLWTMTFASDGAVIGQPGPVDFRVDVTRRSGDAYHWSLSAKAGSAWKPVFALDYLRGADAVL